MDKRFTKLIILNCFTSGHCMIAQLALSMALSYIFSNSIFIFSFFTGLYLMSMGIGALLVEKFDVPTDWLIKFVIVNSILGVLLASPGITGVIVFNEFLSYLLRTYQLDLGTILFPLGIILSILIGIVSGAELPIFSKLIEKENWPTSQPIISVLVSDYFGAFFGVVIFTFILNPFTGILNAIVITQIITLIAINYTHFTLKIFSKESKIPLILMIVNVFVGMMFLYRNTFAGFVDAISGF